MKRFITLLLSIIFLVEIVLGQQKTAAVKHHEATKQEMASDCCAADEVSCCEGSSVENHEETNPSACCGEEQGYCKHPCCQAPAQVQSPLLLFHSFTRVDFHAHQVRLHELHFCDLTCFFPSGVQADSWRPPRFI
jgi:hypothetical protein